MTSLSGYCRYLDVYLMDIKHMDPQKHKAFTSRSNELMLENAKKIARTARRLIIRVPVIPGFNDTEAEIGDIAAFTKSLKTVEKSTCCRTTVTGAESMPRSGGNIR